MTRCDILICGAGISGLLLASELSSDLSVIVIEKNSRSECSNKFWLTTRECLATNHELRTCMDSEWTEMDFVASDRTRFTAKGQYILWNTKRLESHLIEKIIRNGSRVLYRHRFYSYKCLNDAIVCYANNLSLSSSLLIDCMGYSSPIISSANVVKILGYYHLYGRVIKLKKSINPVAADNVILSGQPSYFEVFPRSDGYANVVLIASAKNVESINKLEKDFTFIVEQSHYSEFFEDPKTGDRLHGIVPIGKMRKASLERILFFGEAGQIHPAASCTCLSKLLSQYKGVSESIREKVRTNRLRARDLGSIAIRMSSFSQRFHQNMFREMIRSTSDRGESFIELLHCIDQKSLDDFIFGEITPTHFVQFHNLIKVIKKGNFVWIKPLIKSFFTW
jgi:hypothetical protein